MRNIAAAAGAWYVLAALSPAQPAQPVPVVPVVTIDSSRSLDATAGRCPA